MELYRKENIDALYESIKLDEYDDESQFDARQKSLYNPPELVDFVKRNIRPPSVLEIGAGSGRSLDFFPITNILEPNKFRFSKALERVKYSTTPRVIKQGVAECIPWETDDFNTVLMIGTLGHLRSMYETFIEVNRVLQRNGHFILDTFEGYSGFPGVYPTGQNLKEILADFGFDLVEMRSWPFEGSSSKFFGTSVGLCVKKVEDFDYKKLRHLQLVKVGELYRPVNFQVETRDWNLL